MCKYSTKWGKNANLYWQAQAGDEQELGKLRRMHEGLVHHIVRKQWRGGLSYEEAIHAGREGLWHAILGYDPQQGSAFSSYAGVAIKRRVWRAVQEAEREERSAIELVGCPPPPTEEEVGWEVKATLYEMVRRLPVKQRWIVSRYYGLDGRGGSTLAKLGQGLGCSRQAVHYHLQRALVRLRHPAFSAILRVLLSRNRRKDYREALRPTRRRR